MKSTPSSDTCWQAVLSRDASFDGRFVYGVHSTRIFCRPSCPSRRPRKDGVSFFESTHDAEAAGFRACKRCQPEQDTPLSTQRIAQARTIIEAAAANGETISLEKLSCEVNASPFHLQRTFKQVTGLSPREYSTAARLQRFKHEMQNGENVTNAMFDAGYNSSRSLHQDAARGLGMTPATYGRGGAGTQIQYDITPCEFGFILAAQTPRGLCAVQLGDDERVLEENLKSEFFAADIRRDANSLSGVLQLLRQYIEGANTKLDIPLDVRATAFQMRVWRELQNIRRGETRTYSEVAKSLGQPTAIRAVARACATNSVALVIPCHRVVREGGALAGYRWGIERKKKLLAREQVQNE